MAAFHLCRAGPEDMPAIVAIMFHQFRDPMSHDKFMGPDTPEQHKWLARYLGNLSEQNPHDYWIKIVDNPTGKLIAASNWRIHPSVTPEPFEDTALPWLHNKEERRAEAVKRLTNIMTMRKRLFNQPHISGAMMAKWGCDLADQLFLPVWVEASDVGASLYSKFGFKWIERRDTGGVRDVMKREANASTIEGGKLLTEDAAAAEVPEMKTLL
ncbi:hypothetical protein ANO11243_018920 [Dothideomycetidae sp. 11243]|nr:hypothetical protein ANO11243_018920 [fungal sp. No.11243]